MAFQLLDKVILQVLCEKYNSTKKWVRDNEAELNVIIIFHLETHSLSTVFYKQNEVLYFQLALKKFSIFNLR